MLFICVRFDKAIAGNEEPTRPHRRVIHAAIVGLEHFNNQRNDAFRRVILAALFAFRQCKLTKEVFVNVAENIFALQIELHAIVFRFAETGIGENVNQAD